jgi:hypothetical protein
MQEPREDAKDFISTETILSQIIMQKPTEDAEESISTENEREDPNLNRTFAVRRKAAKRTLPWDIVGEELNLVSLSPPQAEDIPHRRRSHDLRGPFRQQQMKLTCCPTTNCSDMIL